MENTINLKMIKCLLLLAITVNVYALNNGHKEFYVSPTGSDKNNGSINFPFASIEKARDAVRQDRQVNQKKSYTVYLYEGI